MNYVILTRKLEGILFYSITISQLDDGTPKDRQIPVSRIMSNGFLFFINYLV